MINMATREEIASVLRSGIAARRGGDLAEALRLMNEAAALCDADQHQERAYVERELGELARQRHDLSAAQVHYEQAVSGLRAGEDRLKLAHTIRHLGDVHAEQRHFPAADECFAEALQIYRSHPSPPTLDLANAIRAHAALKSERGDHEAARPLWAEAGELYAAVGVAEGVDECRRRGGGFA